jgi:hypothetical protein
MAAIVMTRVVLRGESHNLTIADVDHPSDCAQRNFPSTVIVTYAEFQERGVLFSDEHGFPVTRLISLTIFS